MGDPISGTDSNKFLRTIFPRTSVLIAIAVVAVLINTNFGSSISELIPAVAEKNSANSSFLKFTYSFPAPTLTNEELGTVIAIQDLALVGNPGEPLLPTKTVNILLPQGKEVKNIEVTQGNGFQLPGSHTLKPGQQPYPLNFEGNITPTQPNPIIYDSLKSYPGCFYKVVTAQDLCGYTILTLNLYPVQYVPKNGELTSYPEITITIPLGQSTGKSSSLICRNLPQDSARVRDVIENPETLDTYILETGKRASFGGKGGLVHPADTYSYVIITNEALRDSTGEYTFQDLVASKIAKGISATIVTVENIEACSDYWWNGLYGDGQPRFNDTACHIRNFIKDAYENWETQYILLGGDGDGANVGGESGDNIIPARLFYATLLGGLGEFVASDLYYAALNGTWNNNENPSPTTKDMTITDPGVSGSGEGFLGSPVVDTTDHVVGPSSMKWTCNNLNYNRGTCTLTIAPPYLNISDKRWLNFAIKISRSGYYLSNIILHSSDGSELLYLPQDTDVVIRELPANTWETIHICLNDLMIGADDFNWSRVDRISIEIFNSWRQIGDTVKLDGIYISDFCDDYWGEPGEDDLRAEVAIGRAPVDNDIELSNFIRKTLAYDSSGGDLYLRNVTMVGEHLGFGGIADWGGNYKDEIKDGCTKYGYTTAGISPDYDVSTLYDREWQEHGWPQPNRGNGGWPKSDIINILNNGVHIINHLGHGNNYHVMKLDDPVSMRDGIIGDPCHDVEDLTNQKYFFVYSQACLPGAFDNINPDTCGCATGEYLPYDSIVEHFITGSHGAFAFVANTRSGIGAPDTNGPSQAYDREFFDALYGEQIRTLGWANQASKEDNIGKIMIACMRYCYYEITLFGDPEIAIKDPPLAEHDLCVYKVNASEYLLVNTSMFINATLYNRGQYGETNLIVNLVVNNLTVASKPLASLQSRAYQEVSFSWSEDTPGIYNVNVQVIPVPGEDNTDNNIKRLQITVTSSPPVSAVVLDSMGTDFTPQAYALLNQQWQKYGATAVTVDYTSLNYDGITYRALVASGADVLIIDHACYMPYFPMFDFEYTNEELDAIIQYVKEGHGLIVTSSSFGGNNNRLLPVVGLRNDLPTLFIGGTVGDFHMFVENHPLFIHLSNPFYSKASVRYPSDDGTWDANDVTTGTYMAKTLNSKSAIVVNNNTVYFSIRMHEQDINENDLQLLYNAIRWTHGPTDLFASAHGPYSGIIGESIQFTGSAYGGTPPYSWHWVFGDGTNSTQQNPSHAFSVPGNYTVTFTVTDSEEDIAEDFRSARIVTPPPLEVNAHGPYAGRAGDVTQFIGSATGGYPPYTWLWDFGDGTTSDQQNSSHVYSSGGLYTVTLTVTDTHNSHVNDSAIATIMHLPRSFISVDNDFNSATPGWRRTCFDSIQDGVNVSGYGGTVYVYNGTYYEHVMINKTINLFGEDKNITIIDGDRRSGNGVFIAADRVNISGFLIRNCGGIARLNAGICVVHANYTSISENIVINNNLYGILLYGSSYTTIFKNTLTENGHCGIYIQSSSNYNSIIENTITNTSYGIYLINSFSNSIYHNNFIHNNHSAYDPCSNTWDNGYPSGGNYWSDFDQPNEGAYDDYQGPNQDIPDSDGIADSPYNISGYNISGSTPPNQDRYPLMTPKDSICGDCNYDGIVNVGDVVYLINYLFIGGPAPVPYCAGDVNADDSVNIDDVVYLINYLFIGGPAPDGCCR